MVGNIILPNGSSGADENNYPYILTEVEFLELLNKGYFSSNLIGHLVTLSNSVGYNGGKYIIADVNHDSANTGQSNCYDLISVSCVYGTTIFGSGNDWRASNIRSYLNNNFYPGFSSNFKSHISAIKYNSRGNWYNDDYIISPSATEVNIDIGSAPADYWIEGVSYPIYLSGNAGRSNGAGWWTRSNYPNSDSAWLVKADGTFGLDASYRNSYYATALFRVQ